eukprot:scaffold614_cov367-Prasinococcus_capsulatus_cf.AAC.30
MKSMGRPISSGMGLCSLTAKHPSRLGLARHRSEVPGTKWSLTLKLRHDTPESPMAAAQRARHRRGKPAAQPHARHLQCELGAEEERVRNVEGGVIAGPQPTWPASAW